MGSYRLKSWRSGVTSVAFLTLLATAASVQLYELPAEMDSRGYQDDNFLDTGPMEDQKGQPDLALAKDVPIYRLIRSLQLEARSGPKHRFDGGLEHKKPYFTVQELGDYGNTDAVVKRWNDGYHGGWRNPGYNLEAHYRPRKPKKGNPGICFFKLCSYSYRP